MVTLSYQYTMMIVKNQVVHDRRLEARAVGWRLEDEAGNWRLEVGDELGMRADDIVISIAAVGIIILY